MTIFDLFRLLERIISACSRSARGLGSSFDRAHRSLLPPQGGNSDPRVLDTTPQLFNGSWFSTLPWSKVIPISLDRGLLGPIDGWLIVWALPLVQGAR